MDGACQFRGIIGGVAAFEGGTPRSAERRQRGGYCPRCLGGLPPAGVMFLTTLVEFPGSRFRGHDVPVRACRNNVMEHAQSGVPERSSSKVRARDAVREGMGREKLPDAPSLAPSSFRHRRLTMKHDADSKSAADELPEVYGRCNPNTFRRNPPGPG